MEPNKIMSCEANSRKYIYLKVAPQRKRISSDSRLLPSPKRDTIVSGIVSPNSKHRPPLGDINKNVIRKEHLLQIKESQKKKVITFNKQSGASNSKKTITSHARTETKLPNQAAYMLCNKRTPKTVDKTLFNKRNSKSVLSGGKFYSPIRSNFYLPSNIVFQGIPNVKKTERSKILKHQTQFRYVNDDEFPSDICDEYLEVMVLCEFQKDWKYVSPKGSVKCYQVHSRATVVNWLIRAQEYLNQPSRVLYKTVRLFDTVLGATDVPQNMYQLTSFVIMWIVTKFENIHFPTTKKLARLCNNAYTIEQILKLEKKLLAFFGFDLNVPDTIFYIHFYITKLDHPSELLYNAVQYILECYILHKTSSTVIASVQAAAAVSLALNLLHPTSQLWDSLSNIAGYYSNIELNDVMQDMLKQIHKVQDPNYSFKKYSTQEKQKAATILLRKLIAS